MKIVTITCLLFLAAVSTFGQKPTAEREEGPAIVWTGNQLFSLCPENVWKGASDEETAGHRLCEAYIDGVAQTLGIEQLDHHTALPAFCPSKYVTLRQILDVVKKYVVEHPEKRDMPAPWLVAQPLHEAFPCQK
jgi:Rap1a immunity proteins